MQDKGTGTVVVLHIRIVDRVNCNFCDLLKGKASNGMERTEERSQVPGAVRLYAAAAVHVVDLGPPFLRLEGTYMVPYTFCAIHIFHDLFRHHASFSQKDTPLERDASTRSKGRTRKFDSDQQPGDDF